MKGIELSRVRTLDSCLEDWADIPRMLTSIGTRDHWATDCGYGLNDIYLDAAGLGNVYGKFINSFHGLFLGMSDAWLLRSEASFRSVPAMFINNRPQQQRLMNLFKGEKTFILAAHPYHYILNHYEPRTHIERTGSVFFLPHTLGPGIPRVSISHVIRELQRLPPEWHPIDVCLHPEDAKNASMCNALSLAGLNIVCCGNRHDKVFLHRFYWMCRRRKFSLCVDLSTHVLLSALTGLDIKVLRSIPTMFFDWAINTQWYVQVPDPAYWPLFDEFYSTEPNQTEILRASEFITGGDSCLDRATLRACYEEARALSTKWRGPNGHVRLPCHLWSYVEPGKLKLTSIANALRNRASGNRGKTHPVSLDIWWELIRYERSFQAEVRKA